MACYIDELEAPSVEIKVSVKNKCAVVPAASTPRHSLYLSNLDDMIGSRLLTPSIYFYSKSDLDGNSPAKRTGEVIKKALSRVLVAYYPLAGRLKDVGNGKLEVLCTGEGAVFVQANTDLALADLGSLAMPNPSWKPLIYCFPEEGYFTTLNLPLVIAQVRGFSVGLRICHCICDGMGAMQFVNGWAEIARGAMSVSLPPCWEREHLKPRSPPLVQFRHVEFDNIDDNSNLKTFISQGQLIQRGFCFNRQCQMHLKEQIYRESKVRCTTFDVLAAHVWRSWIKALQITPGDQEMRLSFAANGRSMFKPPIKEGFYGNVLGIACAVSTAQELVSKPLSEAVHLVQAARKSITEEYIRSTIDYLEVERPSKLEFAGKLSITQWTRFSLYDTDFGWGCPTYAGPIDLSPTPQLCVLLPHPKERDSIVVCICLPPSRTSAFRHCLLLQDE